MKELIASGEVCREFSKGIPLYLTEWNIEMNVLGVTRTCVDWNILMTDHFCEICVVAGMGAENKADARVLGGVHCRAAHADADAHHAVVR